jgi:hypothetical protein
VTIVALIALLLQLGQIWCYCAESILLENSNRLSLASSCISFNTCLRWMSPMICSWEVHSPLCLGAYSSSPRRTGPTWSPNPCPSYPRCWLCSTTWYSALTSSQQSEQSANVAVSADPKCEEQDVQCFHVTTLECRFLRSTSIIFTKYSELPAVGVIVALISTETRVFVWVPVTYLVILLHNSLCMQRYWSTST